MVLSRCMSWLSSFVLACSSFEKREVGFRKLKTLAYSGIQSHMPLTIQTQYQLRKGPDLMVSI